jgi:hypothetical protein
VNDVPHFHLTKQEQQKQTNFAFDTRRNVETGRAPSLQVPGSEKAPAQCRQLKTHKARL